MVSTTRISIRVSRTAAKRGSAIDGGEKPVRECSHSAAFRDAEQRAHDRYDQGAMTKLTTMMVAGPTAPMRRSSPSPSLCS